MEIIQEAFSIPDDIATGLATGLYKRYGGVVRYAIEDRKGHIVKHLDVIESKASEQVQGIGDKALQFVQNHEKGMILGAFLAAFGSGCSLIYY